MNFARVIRDDFSKADFFSSAWKNLKEPFALYRLLWFWGNGSPCGSENKGTPPYHLKWYVFYSFISCISFDSCWLHLFCIRFWLPCIETTLWILQKIQHSLERHCWWWWALQKDARYRFHAVMRSSLASCQHYHKEAIIN